MFINNLYLSAHLLKSKSQSIVYNVLLIQNIDTIGQQQQQQHVVNIATSRITYPYLTLDCLNIKFRLTHLYFALVLLYSFFS